MLYFWRNSIYYGTFLLYPVELCYPITSENGKEKEINAKVMCLY